MRLCVAAAVGMATLLSLAGLTNAGVVNRADNSVTGISETAITGFSPKRAAEAPEDSLDVQLDKPNYCCEPGCGKCSRRTCFPGDCNIHGPFNFCCLSDGLAANVVFVEDIEEPPHVPEPVAPTPTTVANSPEKDMAPSVVDRQVQGPNPTPWCCKPGCLECGGYTCWHTPCEFHYNSCCADALLLAKAVFVTDANKTHVPELDAPASEIH